MGHTDKSATVAHYQAQAAEAKQITRPEYIADPWAPVNLVALRQRIDNECKTAGLIDYWRVAHKLGTLAGELATALAKVTGSAQKPQEGCRHFLCSLGDGTVLVEADLEDNDDGPRLLAAYIGGAWIDVDQMPDRFTSVWQREVEKQIYGAIPTAMRTPPAGHVAVHASATAAAFVPHLNVGWNVVDRDEADAIACFCEDNGQANRAEPWCPGERIALQALARQIRARLREAK